MAIFNDMGGDFEGVMPDNMASGEYLRRSRREPARRIRTSLNEWHSRYPASEQAELATRLLSVNNQDHQSAFFELMLHELFLRDGWSAEVHPTVPETTRNPDFKFTKGGQSIIVEAKVVMGRSDQENAAIRRLNALMDTINRRVRADRFFLSIDTEGLPERDIRGRRLADDLQRWLDGLDYDEALRRANQGNAEQYDFRDGNFHVIFEAAPRNREQAQETDRVIGIRSHGHEGGWMQPGENLRGAIEEKARAYGQLNMPYVIAVNVWEFFGDTASDSLEALYGTEQTQVTRHVNGGTEIAQVRARDGCFGTPDNHRKTNVSGVLTVNNASPWALANRNIIYTPHVWSDFPLGSPVTGTTDISFHVDQDGFTIQNGRMAAELLGLPENWPVNGGDEFE